MNFYSVLQHSRASHTGNTDVNDIEEGFDHHVFDSAPPKFMKRSNFCLVDKKMLKVPRCSIGGDEIGGLLEPPGIPEVLLTVQG